MRAVLINGVVAAHRAVFTASAALLGVGGSLLAEDATSVTNWLAVVGPALLVYLEDVCSGIESSARVLDATSPKSLRVIRVEVFDLRRPRLLLGIFGAGVACLIAWAAASVVDHGDRKPATVKAKPAPTVACIASERARRKIGFVSCTLNGKPITVEQRRP